MLSNNNTNYSYSNESRINGDLNEFFIDSYPYISEKAKKRAQEINLYDPKNSDESTINSNAGHDSFDLILNELNEDSESSFSTREEMSSNTTFENTDSTNVKVIENFFHKFLQNSLLLVKHNNHNDLQESSKKRKREIYHLEELSNEELSHEKKVFKNKKSFKWSARVIKKIRGLWDSFPIEEKTSRLQVSKYAKLTYKNFQKSCNADKVSLFSYLNQFYNHKDLKDWIKSKIKNLK